MDAGAAAYKLTVVVRQTTEKAPVPIRQKTAANAMQEKTVWWRLLSNVLYTSWHVSRAVAGRPQVYSVASMHVISPSSALLCALARGRKRSTAQKMPDHQLAVHEVDADAHRPVEAVLRRGVVAPQA